MKGRVKEAAEANESVRVNAWRRLFLYRRRCLCLCVRLCQRIMHGLPTRVRSRHFEMMSYRPATSGAWPCDGD